MLTPGGKYSAGTSAMPAQRDGSTGCGGKYEWGEKMKKEKKREREKKKVSESE